MGRHLAYVNNASRTLRALGALVLAATWPICAGLPAAPSVAIEMDDVVSDSVSFEMRVTLDNRSGEPYEFTWRHRNTEPPYGVWIRSTSGGFSRRLFGAYVASSHYSTSMRLRTYRVDANASIEFIAAINFKDCYKIGECRTVAPGSYVMEVTFLSLAANEPLTATKTFDVVHVPSLPQPERGDVPSIKDVPSLTLVADVRPTVPAEGPSPMLLTISNQSMEPVTFYVCHRPAQPPYRGIVTRREDLAQGRMFGYPYTPYYVNTTLATGRRHIYRVEAGGKMTFADELDMGEVFQGAQVKPGTYSLRMGIGDLYGRASDVASFVVSAPRAAPSTGVVSRPEAATDIAALMQRAATLPRCDARLF